ncbi:MAG TPA: cytochrome c oxidase assembly protein [Steroidobacteraceae bacterium]
MLESRLVHSLGYLAPWEFSPTAALSCVACVAVYMRGLRAGGPPELAPRWWRTLSFVLGVTLVYVVLQTRIDYYSQHMFWVHRLQHLILHHVCPMLIVLAVPGATLTRGLPITWQRTLEQRTRVLWWRWIVRIVQQPLIASVLFVGVIGFWLIPSIHFTAMLDVRRYRAMNWSMLIDGLLFWWLVLTPRAVQGCASIRYFYRAIMVVGVTFPQIFIGAYITLHRSVLYGVYGICGRAWAISPMLDQQLGGLLTWIPPAMMSLLGLLIVLHLMFRDLAAAERAPRAAILAAAKGAG